jgi:hypothetical protein
MKNNAKFGKAAEWHAFVNSNSKTPYDAAVGTIKWQITTASLQYH